MHMLQQVTGQTCDMVLWRSPAVIACSTDYPRQHVTAAGRYSATSMPGVTQLEAQHQARQAPMPGTQLYKITDAPAHYIAIFWRQCAL